MNDVKYVSQPINGIKSFRVEGDQLIVPVIGIPFNGPAEIGGKDLHNEWFDKSTDVGPLNEAMVYFNHNRFYPLDDSPAELERMATLARAYKGEVLGIAKKAETTEEGVIYNLVLDMRKRYVKYLKEMIENNLLDVSSGAKYAELDPTSEGRISKWHTVEISLTPSPANPNAVPLTKSILEKALGENEMPDNINPEAVENVAGDESLIPDDVKSAFASIEPKKEEAPSVTVEQFNELKSQNEALATELAEIKTLIKSVQATLPYMVKQFGEIFQREATKSTFETSVTRASQAPAPAPTPEKRAIFGDKGPAIRKAPGVK